MTEKRQGRSEVLRVFIVPLLFCQFRLLQILQL